MFDNFFQDNYQSYNKVYIHPETLNSIFLGDMQSAIDADFLSRQHVKTGTFKSIQSSRPLKIWITLFSVPPSSMLSILSLIANKKISPIFLMRSTCWQRRISAWGAFLCTVQPEYQEYAFVKVELYISDIVYHEERG